MELNDLPIVQEIDDELSDPAFANMTHGRSYAYNKGCTGPLCRKGNRDRARERNGRAGRQQPLDPYIESRYRQHLADIEESKQTPRKVAG